jgi:hypothetical protein
MILQPFSLTVFSFTYVQAYPPACSLTQQELPKSTREGPRSDTGVAILALLLAPSSDFLLDPLRSLLPSFVVALNPLYYSYTTRCASVEAIIGESPSLWLPYALKATQSRTGSALVFTFTHNVAPHDTPPAHRL